MYNWNLWLDKYNILHLSENPNPESTENGLTFTGILHVLWRKAGMKAKLPTPDLNNFCKPDIQEPNLFLPTPVSEDNSHMSLDNMFGIYVLREFYSPLTELPTTKWYKPHGHTEPVSKRFLRPDVMAYFGLINGNFFARLFAKPILLFAAKLSCCKPKSVTSGKILWFSRFALLSLSEDEKLREFGEKGLKMVEKETKKIHGDKPFIDIFDFYYNNPEHPLRKLIRKYYGIR